MPPPRRAMRDEDKQRRREAIQAAALALFARQPYESISMSGIARACGLAKGTLYLYFRTREELFLALLGAALRDWAAAVQAGLADEGPLTPETLSARLLASLEPRPQLLRLLAILHTVLERNLGLEAARAFKLELLELASAIGARLEQRLPGLAPGEGLRLLLRVHALIIGLQQQAEPSPVMAEILAEPALAPLRVDFRTDFEISLLALLRGLTHDTECSP